MILFIARTITKLLLKLRYRIHVSGQEKCLKLGNKGILFLPNHPALIDPVILCNILMSHFRVRAVANEKQIRTTVLKYLYKPLGILQLPDIGIAGRSGHELVLQQLQACIDALKAGDNLLFYPAGRIYRSKMEKLRGNGGVARILEEYPDVRIVLVRTTGLWGSDFGRAKGYQIGFGETIRKHIKHILCNGIFFGPRRDVYIELVNKPADFPKTPDRETLNRYLEDFYNQAATSNTYVPYCWYEHGGVRVIPEPGSYNAAEDTSRIPPEVRDKIYQKLHAITGKRIIKDSDTLGTDLALDSLIIAELHAWLQDEFAHEINSPETLRTVASLQIAAIGESSATEPLLPIPQNWFIGADARELYVEEGEKITDIFLKNASLYPSRPLLADQGKGVFSSRKTILAILALKDSIAAIPGEKVGILMPASSISTILYLATLFAGKVPVLINWTVGLRNMDHCINTVGLDHILTANVVIERLTGKGVLFGEQESKFLYLENIAAKITTSHRIMSLLRSHFCWSQLRRAKVADIAAILFTSGSENLPKAVPLTHQNLISDLRYAMKDMKLRQDDCLLGMLPPFHSFGLLLNVMMPACTRLRVVYHANPTEGDMLARLIAAYKVTMAVGTPTFVNNILRNASGEQAYSLRVVITGAEKCTDSVYELIRQRCPEAIVLEGYGITECGPIVSLNKPGAVKAGTIGHPLECIEWLLLNEQKEIIRENGQTGMLLVRGPNVFHGYINFNGENPFEEIAGKTWYRTGDLIAMDEDGFMVFKGRLKRFVKIGGEMVSLPAIEEILVAAYQAQVKDGPVLAVEALGEELQPLLTLFTTIPLEREEVNNHLREAGMASLNFIRQIIPIKEIPLLGTGKIDYRSMKSLAQENTEKQTVES
ncbi:MAG: acyl-[ACP]--phospholipid O-acyltransferase [Lentisphaeria bacterium]